MLARMHRAAFFDLDGTLLAANSAALWIQSERRLGRLGRLQAARAALFLLGYRLSVVDAERAMAVAVATLRGHEEAAFRSRMVEWYRQEVAARMAPGAHRAVARHRARGDLLVLLTSAPPYIAEEARAQLGLDEALCSRYCVDDGRFTGLLHLPVCYGPGKVEHAEQLAERVGIDLTASAFYTDSYTDLPMLLRVGEPHAVNPDPRLRLAAWRRRWPVHDWRRADHAPAAHAGAASSPADGKATAARPSGRSPEASAGE